jgi:opacity protein-like surface antigen
MKVTHELLDPDKKLAVDEANPNRDPLFIYKLHDQYTSSEDSNGFTFSAGTGIDYKLSNAIAVRVAGLEYSRSTVANVGGMNYSHGFQISTGMVLRLGTW